MLPAAFAYKCNTGRIAHFSVRSLSAANTCCFWLGTILPRQTARRWAPLLVQVCARYARRTVLRPLNQSFALCCRSEKCVSPQCVRKRKVRNNSATQFALPVRHIAAPDGRLASSQNGAWALVSKCGLRAPDTKVVFSSDTKQTR